MICIYGIRNKVDGKIYIGKTINFKQRMLAHKYSMTRYSKVHSNRHLYNACQKYGFDSFEFILIEIFKEKDEKRLADRELYWMLHYQSTDRKNGYNLGLDSSTKCIKHEETLKLMSFNFTGKKNPNYGNKWTETMKKEMSENAKKRHADGQYGEEWRDKISKRSKTMWKDPERKKRMAENVSRSKQKYNFRQLTKEGELVQVWSSIKEIVSNNPTYKWQNIYSVCNGYKKSYMGFVWEKEIKQC